MPSASSFPSDALAIDEGFVVLEAVKRQNSAESCGSKEAGKRPRGSSRTSTSSSRQGKVARARVEETKGAVRTISRVTRHWAARTRLTEQRTHTASIIVWLRHHVDDCRAAEKDSLAALEATLKRSRTSLMHRPWSKKRADRANPQWYLLDVMWKVGSFLFSRAASKKQPKKPAAGDPPEQRPEVAIDKVIAVLVQTERAVRALLQEDEAYSRLLATVRSLVLPSRAPAATAMLLVSSTSARATDTIASLLATGCQPGVCKAWLRGVGYASDMPYACDALVLLQNTHRTWYRELRTHLELHETHSRQLVARQCDAFASFVGSLASVSAMETQARGAIADSLADDRAFFSEIHHPDDADGCGAQASPQLHRHDSVVSSSSAEMSNSPPRPEFGEELAPSVAKAGIGRFIRDLEGRYSAVRFLAKGGQGELMLVKDAVKNELCASKTMAFDNLALLHDRYCIAKEHARVLCDHPNIVEYREVKARVSRYLKPELTIVMPYYEGGTVADFVKRQPRKQPIGLDRILDIGHQLCTALAHLHEMSPPLVHRDVKLENILLAEEGRRVILLDFDVARPLHKTLTSQSGTYQYTAPETIVWFQTTQKSDMFAVGIVLFILCLLPDFPMLPLPNTSEEMLLNSDKWEAGTLEEAMRRSFSSYMVKRPPQLVSLVIALCRHDPEQRLSAANTAEIIRAMSATTP